MQTITESMKPERDAQIIAELEAASAEFVAAKFGLSISTVYRIARREKASALYDLSITDGHQTVPVGKIITSRGFIHACQRALREYPAFFYRLEFPQWKLVTGSEQIDLNKLKAAD